MQTVESIMLNLEQKISANEPISPVYWLEAALRVNALATSLDNQVANFENELNHLEAEYLKQDMPSTKAKTLAKANIDYEKYLCLKALIKRVENFLSTARRRAQINEL